MSKTTKNVVRANIPITFQCPPKLKTRCESVAAQYDLSLSAFIRSAMRDLMARMEVK